MAHYQASSDHVQKLARDFFCAMDHDNDGKIDQNEFLEFMKEEGYAQMTNSSFFRQLDLDGNGTLDFREVMTLYYIVKTGRPFCDDCKKFIPNTYFTCVGCLEAEIGGSFYLCFDCYSKPKCDHTHNGLFLDNYSLLEVMIKAKLSQAKSKPSTTALVPYKPPNYTWNPSLAIDQAPYRPPPTPIYNYNSWTPSNPPPPIHHHTRIQNNYSFNNPPPRPVQQHGAHNAIVPQVPYGPPLPPTNNNNSWTPSDPPPHIHHHTWIQNNYYFNHPPPRPEQHPGAHNAIVPQRQKWKIALEALDAALYIGAIGSNFCVIL